MLKNAFLAAAVLTGTALSSCTFMNLAGDPPPGSPKAIEAAPLPVFYFDSFLFSDTTGDWENTIARLRTFENTAGSSGLLTDDTEPSFLLENAVTDSYAAVKVRGKSSGDINLMPKRSFGLELRDTDNYYQTADLPLFGLPEENDWVLHASYSDKSLMRNHMAYWISNAIGLYAPKTKYIEVYGTQLPDSHSSETRYQGIYLLTEKIKIDRNRVDIAKLTMNDNTGDAVTGGYILKIDKGDGGENYIDGDRVSNLIIEEPASRFITNPQYEYISGYIRDMDTALSSPAFADPVNGYRKYLDPESFADFFIVNEITRNIDGYRISTYMNKDRGGRLKAGPVWDFDITLGNASYYNGLNADEYFDNQYPDNEEWGIDGRALGWMIVDEFESLGRNEYEYHAPFWWRRLLKDPYFRSLCRERWKTYRQGPLSDASIEAEIDSAYAKIKPAINREFTRWDRLHGYDWPNPWPIPWNTKADSSYTYEDHLNFMKTWLKKRVAWMDDKRSWDALASWGNAQ